VEGVVAAAVAEVKIGCLLGSFAKIMLSLLVTAVSFRETRVLRLDLVKISSDPS